MKIKIFLFQFLFLISFLSSQTTIAESRISAYRERRPGHVLYQLKSRVNSADSERVQKTIERLNVVDKQTFSMNSQVHLAHSKNRQMTEEQIAEQLMATGLVEYAEPDYKVYPVGVPNDPLISKQWHHTTLKTFEAWNTTSGLPEVVVTVCDSGVDANHPDLKSNVILPGYNTVDGSTKTGPVNLHGTAVAGLIAAKSNNRIGISGIAPNVKILPVRVSNNSSGSAYLSDLAECVRYGADHGAKVHNISFTGSESRTIDAAAQYARSKGSLLFMAAGNQGADISNSNPGYPSFIRVGSTTQRDDLSSFSNYGNPIDLVAPGSSVYTTTLNGSYISISGTSFSSPIAAAVGALIFSVNPKFTPIQVTEIIFKSADSIGNSYYFGNGRVNALNAVKEALKKSGR